MWITEPSPTHYTPNDLNSSHAGIRNLGRIQLGPLLRGLSDSCNQCWLRSQPHLQARQGKDMLPNLLRGCWQDSGLYEVWQITTLSSFLAKQSSLLRVATQKELERSQQDTVRTWHDLVSKTVSTTLAVFCGSASGRSLLCPHSEDRSHTRTCTPGVGVTGSQAR